MRDAVVQGFQHNLSGRTFDTRAAELIVRQKTQLNVGEIRCDKDQMSPAKKGGEMFVYASSDRRSFHVILGRDRGRKKAPLAFPSSSSAARVNAPVALRARRPAKSRRPPIDSPQVRCCSAFADKRRAHPLLSPPCPNRPVVHHNQLRTPV